MGGAAAAGASLAPRWAAAATDRRVFKLVRDGSDVGEHSLTLTRSGDQVRMQIAIDIRIRFLGITAYRYEHENTEVWSGGRLVSLDSKTYDDGEEDFVRIRRAGDALQVEGSAYSGPAPSDAAPTSYWLYDAAFDSPNWISSQSGKLLTMSYAKSATSGGGQVVKVTGGFETQLIYDADREWRGCAFDGGGELIVYEQLQPGPAFRPIALA